MKDLEKKKKVNLEEELDELIDKTQHEINALKSVYNALETKTKNKEHEEQDEKSEQ